MRLEKREHPEARDELRKAAYWYDDRESGLGEDFYDAIDETIARILRLAALRACVPRLGGHADRA